MSHYPGHNPHSSHSGNQGKYLWDQVKVQIPNPNVSAKLYKAFPLAQSISKSSNDATETFNFNLGTSF